MIRRPPRSTLFPYTPLSRSLVRTAFKRSTAERPALGGFLCVRTHVLSQSATTRPVLRGGRSRGSIRSEEHTSELQSRLHLVCRLLLEKKKKYKKMYTPTTNL